MTSASSEIIADILLRLSTADQLRGNSFDTQLEDCLKIARENGFKVGRIYREVESARKIEVEREQYRQLIENARAGRFRALIIWKIDRFTRNSVEGLRAIKLLVDELGIELYSATERIDTKTADGRRNLRHAISEAEYEVERLIERVTPGMKQGVKKGHWQGARYCFYGFRYDKPNKRLIEVPEEIKVLKIICDLRKTGMAIYSIALRLSEMGIRNRAGRLFTTHQLDVMLNRSIYADGIYHAHGERSAQPIITPVIDQQTWELVQQVNKGRKREAKSVSPGRITSSYTIQGIFKCFFCGKNMVGQSQLKCRKTKERRPVYGCGLRAQRTCRACEGQFVRADVAHDLAFGVLKRVMQNPQLIELTKRQLRTALENNQPHLSKRIYEVRETIQKLKRDQQKCRDAYYQEATTLQQFKEENLRLVREQEAAEQELKNAELKLHGADLFKGRIDQVFELLQDFETVWSKMTPVQQRIVYRGVFNYLKIKGAKWSKHFELDVFSLKQPFESWYHGRVWNGSLQLTEDGSAFITDNSQQDKDLCGKSTFAHSAAK